MWLLHLFAAALRVGRERFGFFPLRFHGLIEVNVFIIVSGGFFLMKISESESETRTSDLFSTAAAHARAVFSASRFNDRLVGVCAEQRAPFIAFYFWMMTEP